LASRGGAEQHHAMPRRRVHLTPRGIVAGGVALLAIALVCFTGYVGWVGSDDFLDPPRSEDCRTPSVQFGWAYEAINYDVASDADLRPGRRTEDGGQRWTCRRDGQAGDAVATGAPAGSDVITSDGVRIAGWYVPAASGVGPTGPTLVVVHGRSSNKSDYLRYAASLHQDFNLVALDLRDAGQSDRAQVTLGARERLDVEAVLDWVERTKAPRWIGGLGTSLGAATLVAVAVEDDRLQALVLDSMHARVVTSWGNGLQVLRGIPAQPGAWAIVTFASLRAGVDIPAVDPVRLIGRLDGLPVLLTHGGRDDLDVPASSLDDNVREALRAGVGVHTYVCPTARHAEVADTCPRDWAAVVGAFLGGSAAAR
jgi:dienelactone hydrolase